MHTKSTKPKCPKCGSLNHEVGEMRATGGMWSKFFNIQNKHFTSVSCQECGYTEFYKKNSSTAGNIIDFFGN